MQRLLCGVEHQAERVYCGQALSDLVRGQTWWSDLAAAGADVTSTHGMTRLFSGLMFSFTADLARHWTPRRQRGSPRLVRQRHFVIFAGWGVAQCSSHPQFSGSSKGYK